MNTKRKIIEIDEKLCDGCGTCVPACAEGAITIIDSKAKVISDKYCDGLGACIGECPQGALRIIEREAEEFDEVAVAAHLSQKEMAETAHLSEGCPSARLQTFTPEPQPETDSEQGLPPHEQSSLSNWPIQIRLVPPDAPFLKGADLLVTADCTPLAYPSFHRDFLKGKVVLMGCPKFDDREQYKIKFAEIFSLSEIKHVTAVVMEVPCCQGLPLIVRKAMKEAGKKIPFDVIVLSIRGKIIKKVKDAA